MLIILYFSRRLVKQLYYYLNIREHLIFSRNKFLLFCIGFQLIVNVIYVFWDLLMNYSVYSLLPLFYFSLLQIPMFKLDSDKKYENATKEMTRSFKSNNY